MTGPTPSPEPAAVDPAEAQDDTAADIPAETEADAEAPPANRAERRARKSGRPPAHVGPQSALHDHGGKGPRSHTKRI
ncbi:hypothetical protein [Pseudonocardia humida]|uniref:Uncharacterized protein n=1 Tax=Pseudonocardia humida TaxID=2800819 RepID=A0ABT1ADQ6_9PSEU|nr:hypothetical protein [Pseudonocardia humida]MCO1661133.1 hypothetical protein [Pseudonocardia humida]